MAEFSFVFVAMGQGDCCIVKCPDGKVVVVDCGSSANAWGDRAYFVQAQMQLRSWCATQGNKIAALILTHPDADHHNKVVDFFSQWAYSEDVTLPSGVTVPKPTLAHCNIDKIYFSSAVSTSSPLGNYTAGALNNSVYNGYFATSELYEVTINNTNDSLNRYFKWSSSDGFKTPTATAISNKRLTILNGTTDGKNWSISIIAGNVPSGYGGVIDNATEDNAKSLVTLLEVDGKKALLTGDATFSTEQFLCTIHRDLLSNLELAQVPHHGSSYASSGQFVDTVTPKAAVVSVAFLEHSYRLPWYGNVLDHWLNVVDGRGAHITYHDIDYWHGPIATPNIIDTWNQWTNNGADKSRVGSNTSGNFWYLLQPANGNFALYQFTFNGAFLYRETVQSNLCLTSQKTQTYTLSDTGVTYTG